MATLVPSQPADRSGPGLRGEVAAFREVQVWLSLAVTVLGFGGMFGAFTYIAYTLTEVSGFASGTVPWLLILFGTGLFAGNYLGGRAADRSVPRTLFVVLGALALVMAVFAATATSQAVTVSPSCSWAASGSPRCQASRCGSWTMRGRRPRSPRGPTSLPSTWATRRAPGSAG